MFMGSIRNYNSLVLAYKDMMACFQFIHFDENVSTFNRQNYRWCQSVQKLSRLSAPHAVCAPALTGSSQNGQTTFLEI